MTERCPHSGDFLTPYAKCPRCGAAINCHEEMSQPDVPPAEGDVSICWSCGQPAIFFTATGSLSLLRLPTDDEQRGLDSDPRVQVAIAAMRESFDPRADDESVLGGRS